MKKTYDVPPLKAGTYGFICSVHPNMTGTHGQLGASRGDYRAAPRPDLSQQPVRLGDDDRPSQEESHPYIINSFIFFFIGGILAMLVRTEFAVPGLQFVTDRTYNETFAMHATLMIFLFVIPMLAASATTSYRSASARRTWPFRASTHCPSGCCRWAASRSSSASSPGRGRSRLDRLQPACAGPAARRPGRAGPVQIVGLALVGTSSILGSRQLPGHDLQDARAWMTSSGCRC